MEMKTRHNSRLSRRQTAEYKKLCAKDERNASFRKITSILQKPVMNRTTEDQEILVSYSDIVSEVRQRMERRSMVKQRLAEVEEPPDELIAKCRSLAQSIRESQHLVIYTGAGISTAARIPDYRGTNGIWTRLQQGKEIGKHDLSLAEPTYTHMALSTLYHRGLLKYVVSQNCDGLHLRSGLPRQALSELHGNMSIEVCKSCKPHREYWRLFDVTENTARYSHKTMRRCYVCNNALVDTIVHFGERGTLQWPLNWQGACKHADEADTIICLGSSLKVLKKYPWLWQMDKPAKKRPNLYIVNLQWTPKDESALLKIHGKCDAVMEIIMSELGIPVQDYKRDVDPIFVHATSILEAEIHTNTQPELRSVSWIKPEDDDKKDGIKIEPLDVPEGDNPTPFESTDGDNNSPPSSDLQSTNDPIVNSSERVDRKTEAISIRIDCDNLTSNNGTSSIPLPSKLQKESPIKDSIFAIDNLLNCDNRKRTRASSRAVQKLHFPPNASPSSSGVGCPTPRPPGPYNSNSYHLDYNTHLQTILSCYQAFTNPIFHQQYPMLSPSLYPYQTSFLYSGLHSIINPMPFFNYDFPDHPAPNYNPKLAAALAPFPTGSKAIEHIVSDADRKPACCFCHETYKSIACLFYTKHQTRFEKTIYRFSKTHAENKPVFCECCDYTSSSESEDDGDKKTKCVDVPAEDTGTDACMAPPLTDGSTIGDVIKAVATSAKISSQPGWFGKGYRKNRRTKKR